MKPTIEEVLQVLIKLSEKSMNRNKWVYTFDIINNLQEHHDNVLPILLLLEKDECLKFNNKDRQALVLLKKEVAA